MCAAPACLNVQCNLVVGIGYQCHGLSVEPQRQVGSVNAALPYRPLVNAHPAMDPGVPGLSHLLRSDQSKSRRASLS